MSQASKRLASEVQGAMGHPPYRDLFDFRPSAGPAPLLLILGTSQISHRQDVLCSPGLIE